jgi:hypothetical protein
LKASSAEVEGSEEVAKAATKSDDLTEELRSKAKDRRFLHLFQEIGSTLISVCSRPVPRA